MTVEQALNAALELTRGSYQRDLALGRARLSGADLHGRARSWGRFYKRSRDRFLARCDAAGIPYHIDRTRPGPDTLVWGDEGDTQ